VTQAGYDGPKIRFQLTENGLGKPGRPDGCLGYLQSPGFGLSDDSTENTGCHEARLGIGLGIDPVRMIWRVLSLSPRSRTISNSHFSELTGHPLSDA
jgi:hypothetical protein